ncbi:hypothetical protein MKW94_003596 [Papaver nudicaule]|uniref:Dolichyl-diphosphooligosaccharide-protein glycosyltransferase subunit OST5 n=1 Tax=Papaver nudicaule TaxID=74823 RepID=A0AA41W082_PAPNU|nr:hypothetical protein [Papaver nudicaule]
MSFTHLFYNCLMHPVCLFFFLFLKLLCYEATSSKKTRSISKELITGAVTSIFLGFGSLFLLLATGVYV